jgi:hypothetical protein
MFFPPLFIHRLSLYFSISLLSLLLLSLFPPFLVDNIASVDFPRSTRIRGGGSIPPSSQPVSNAVNNGRIQLRTVKEDEE